MSIRLAADTGGTFTDVVAITDDGRHLLTAKALTTYDGPMRGFMAGVGRAGVTLADASDLKFGTTLVINSLLQRRGAETALLCTRGFRDTLEIRRGNRVSPFDLRYQHDPALVARRHRLEIDERIDATGGIVQPLDEAQVVRAAAELRGGGIEAIAVCFLNAYANDAHERRAMEILRQELPGVFITCGSDLTREWYEYERTSTAAANAYVGPALSGFMGDMKAGLEAANYAGAIYLMASNGGVLSLDEAGARPVQLVESGPVGGCIGAAAYSRELGIDKMIAFDMGGTTAKCALIEDGAFQTRSPYYVGGREKGFPIRGAVIDIVEVGAGGGSIASLDSFGRLRVGPQSAGSTPGPACYGLGGTEPTMTDANVLLGRIAPESFLGGEMALDSDAARGAVLEKIARPMGYGGDDLAHVAQGIVDIGILTMSGAISEITTERGLDPRDFSLFVFGGGGPLHGLDLARRMGIPQVIVPPHPGVFSAVGMLFADARIDESMTFLHPLADETVPTALANFEKLEALAASRLPSGEDAGEIRCERYADMRYKGQRHALKVLIEDASTAEALKARFSQAYFGRFSFVDEKAPVEFVAIGVTAMRSVGALAPTSLATAPESGADPAPEATRSIYFACVKRWEEAPVYAREQLPMGFAATGPLVIQEYGSSVILAPGDLVTVGRLGELQIRVEAA